MKYDRSKFNLEECHNRRIARGDFNIEKATDGELTYMMTVAELWRASGYNGIRAIGRALFTTVDAEKARREWKWHGEMAVFDAMIAAENQPEPLPSPDPSTLPKWSDLPPEPMPDVSAPDG
ncbi:hypothetical protein [Mycolicibacterium celeriflavum]|uniref:Uncharacterized protein n=1 Tax=Mycolicibacterium celeriflavum TaxID=1249101 RepID=A0A1X0BKK3_MYCCF|nr:hypothetical protein [Mycolicibacterium celeriflavum]MCV7236551.1 hypothetical protein [Mycolicibacterium celeriflavum]ORA43050.1 hypothetical protein BST21_22495 [Mycolicibacterium celeriflavum]BBY41806.1 hypothetical protein MCEL_01010 [Mycolicibacterium celeriflavum]